MDRQDIAEILLKVVLNTVSVLEFFIVLFFYFFNQRSAMAQDHDK
jgi:hypothetical protein